MVYHMQFLKISFPSQKTWTIICNLYNFYPFSKKCGLSYAISTNFFPFSKNVNYTMQFLEFLSLLQKHGPSYVNFCKFLSRLQKHGLSYATFGIYFPSPKTWTIIHNFRNL